MFNISKELVHIRTLLAALEEPGTCFLLGAGVSAGLVPFGSELAPLVRKRIMQAGAFPAIPTPRDAISDRILGPPQNHHATIEDELAARHFSPAAVGAAHILFLHPEAQTSAPPQYEIFGLSKYRLVIINFNVDGNASRYCGGQHTVINMHGTAPSAKARIHIGWDEHINMLQMFSSLRHIEISGLFPIGREPEQMAKSPGYQDAQLRLFSAKRVLLVGYSFGGMDDIVAYDMLLKAIWAKGMAVVVINPFNARNLAERLAEDSRHQNIGSLSVFWDKFAAATLTSRGWQGFKTCDHSRLCYRCIAYLYDAFLDGGKVPKLCK